MVAGKRLNVVEDGQGFGETGSSLRLEVAVGTDTEKTRNYGGNAAKLYSPKIVCPPVSALGFMSIYCSSENALSWFNEVRRFLLMAGDGG